MAIGSDLHRDAPVKLKAFYPKDDFTTGRFSWLEEQDRVWYEELGVEKSWER